jgi:hypothetical protein
MQHVEVQLIDLLKSYLFVLKQFTVFQRGVSLTFLLRNCSMTLHMILLRSEVSYGEVLGEDKSSMYIRVTLY